VFTSRVGLGEYVGGFVNTFAEVTVGAFVNTFIEATVGVDVVGSAVVSIGLGVGNVASGDVGDDTVVPVVGDDVIPAVGDDVVPVVGDTVIPAVGGNVVPILVEATLGEDEEGVAVLPASVDVAEGLGVILFIVGGNVGGKEYIAIVGGEEDTPPPPGGSKEYIAIVGGEEDTPPPPEVDEVGATVEGDKVTAAVAFVVTLGDGAYEAVSLLEVLTAVLFGVGGIVGG